LHFLQSGAVPRSGTLHDEAMDTEQKGVVFAFSQGMGPAQYALRIVDAHKAVREYSYIFVMI
jgi:hypothetical protein